MVRLITGVLILTTLYIGAAGAYAVEPASGTESPEDFRGLVLRIPLVDVPFNYADGYSFPSMNQSLYLSKDAAQAAHSALSSMLLPQGRWTEFFGLAVFDFLFFTLPGGSAWVHEEWHRAVMTNRGIASFDDVYKFDLFAESIAVSHVRDADLVRLKDRHPAEFVRLSAAGNEAEIELATLMRRDSFFEGRRLGLDSLYWWFSLINSWYYVYMCGTPDATRFTDQMNREDGTDVARRDFTGLDFTAWVYDLFRPDEPYAARGTHPSGVGIDRYIKYSDLTGDERRYLRLQGKLALINFISPQLLGVDYFGSESPFGGDRFFWNFAAVHHLTPFGYTIDANLFLMRRAEKLHITAHAYANRRGAMPGLHAALVRRPVALFGNRAYLNATLGAWIQPEDQMFRGNRNRPGGEFIAGVDVPVAERLELYMECGAKSEGWVAGNVSLERDLQMRAGVSVIL
ncbi:MAG: hypothetical protein EPN93_09275 [Spirochaetes bacterium]|nr:MAG: hypothetical protein EPN93_09275 [Spirochaetota bacterium]